MDIQELIKAEEKRQEETLTLIPSENYASAEIRAAVGSKLMNKYSEGYPGKKYYQGNKYVEQIEQIAIDEAKKVFGVPHANVQPLSGGPANMAAILAICKPGDRVTGLKLPAGGHLSHGHDVNFSGKLFTSVQFDVDADGLIDYATLEQLAYAENPKIFIVGTTAYPRIIDWERVAKIADAGGAYLLADISHEAGLIAAGVLPSPVKYAHVVMATTHKTLRGPRGAILMVTQKGLDKDPDLAKKIDRAVFPGMQGGPHQNTTAAIALALQKVPTPEFKSYAKQVIKNAKVLSEELIKLGFNITTGGTDNHLMVIDLRNKNIAGKDAAVLLEESGIVVNYNTIPHDPNPPMHPSGIRLGTPAVTTRGLKETEMVQLAKLINEVLVNKKNVATEVKNLCKLFPAI